MAHAPEMHDRGIQTAKAGSERSDLMPSLLFSPFLSLSSCTPVPNSE